jgi:hypothetical protein
MGGGLMSQAWDADNPRFTVETYEGMFTGVLDRQRDLFAWVREAVGHDGQPTAQGRAQRMADRLNSGEDTTTGFIWEQIPDTD